MNHSPPAIIREVAAPVVQSPQEVLAEAKKQAFLKEVHELLTRIEELLVEIFDKCEYNRAYENKPRPG